ncbi:MAG: CotH kinase family protein, partial [Bacteroidales bacterium]|nr:CotH kinase family protein [Bacteroidales bacterium]
MVDVKWTWQSGDKLAVYDGTDKREFTLDESAAGTAVAKFTGKVAETFTSLQAVFPYDAAGASFGTPLTPAVQTVASGTTIDPAAMIAIAESAVKVSNDEFNFYFTSGVSMLRFTVPDGVQKVILHTEGKEATIAGESRSVTVSVPGAGQYWAAVNPASYEGLKVFSRTSDGDFMKSTTATIDLSAPGKAKKWTLLNNYGDKTLMRNLLAFELSRCFEMPYTPFGQAVDVLLNGEYKGNYH